MKIEVRIRVSDEESYSTKTVASSEINETVVGEFNKRTLTSQIQESLDAAQEKVESQLKAVDKAKKAEAASEDED